MWKTKEENLALPLTSIGILLNLSLTRFSYLENGLIIKPATKNCESRLNLLVTAKGLKWDPYKNEFLLHSDQVKETLDSFHLILHTLVQYFFQRGLCASTYVL